jgi:tryptophan-rich sensory protein
MGAASYFIYEKKTDESKRGLTAYIIYLVLNILWPVAFFEKGAFAAALILLAAQLFMLFVIVSSYSKTDKKAAYLMIPTIIWSLFALYLNMGFLLLNR